MSTKAEIIKKLEEVGIKSYPEDASKAELEVLLKAAKGSVTGPSKEKNLGSNKLGPGPVKQDPKISNKTVERKIDKDEVIQLQKDGKLVGYDPATGIGIVREEGYKTRWPGDGAGPVA